jgi:hypothetical protein
MFYASAKSGTFYIAKRGTSHIAATLRGAPVETAPAMEHNTSNRQQLAPVVGV